MRTLQPSTAIMRLPSVLNAIGVSRATLYKQIQAGLFPKPISLGARSVGWSFDEVQAVINARIIGMNDEELITLISQLHQDRQNLSISVN